MVGKGSVGLQGMAKHIEATVGDHPVRHVQGVQRVNQSQRGFDGSGTNANFYFQRLIVKNGNSGSFTPSS